MSAYLDRRAFWQLTTGLSLSFALPAMSPRAAERRGAERLKSLIIIWLEGGPSQLETWDPHPGGPIGGPTRAITTAVPGLSIADSFPRVAQQIHHLSVVRSLVSKEGDHDRARHYVHTGYRPDGTVIHPALGSILARELPAKQLEIPQFVSLGYTEGPSRGGYLGGQFDAYYVADPATTATFAARSQDDRQQRRLAHLDVLSESFASGRQAAFEQTLYRNALESAVRMMASEQLQAFDIETEAASVRAAYGEASVGRSCLVARRLIETGVRVVEVNHLNYDTHQDNFHSHRRLAGELDGALAALLEDLVHRDLLESTVVLCLGEFGRTPRINRQEGRDHWPSGFSCLVGGGGLKSGVVIGATDPQGQRQEPENPVRIEDLYATVLNGMGVDYKHAVITPIGRPLRYADGTPLQQLGG